MPEVKTVIEAGDRQQRLLDRGWPSQVVNTIREIMAFKPGDVGNAGRLGDLRFADAEERLPQVQRTLRDITEETFNELPPNLIGDMEGNLGGLRDTLKQMAELSPANYPGDIRPERDTLQNEFNRYYQFFQDQVRPHAITARVEEIVSSRANLSQDDLDSVREQLADLRAQADDLRSLAPLVDAQREAVGEAGVADLSRHFEKRSGEHAASFKRWAIALVITLAFVGTGTILAVYFTRPGDNATNGQIASHLIFDFLVIGFTVFLLRFVAIQTRAHRHMQFVAKNKANALSTFNLIVAGQEEADVRANVALALAQAVFNSDDGVFSDATGDTVTVFERLGTAVSRGTGTPT
jgi:hypothetical protein